MTQPQSDPGAACRLGEVQLRLVFQNLIANALKDRSDAPPRTRVGAEPAPNGLASLYVRDDGIGLETVAEGVETEAQRDYLCERGCGVLQSYLFGKPMEPEAFRAALARRTDEGDPA